MSTLLLRRFFGSLLLLALLLGIRPAQASHLLGGEMSYRYLDANGPGAAPFRYEMTVTFYINGLQGQNVAGPLRNLPVGIYNRTTGARIPMSTVNYPNIMGGDVNLINPTNSRVISPSVPMGCAVVGPSQPFIINKFVAVINLPVSFDGYYAVASPAARNYTLTNLDAPQSNAQPLTLYVSMAPPLIYNRSPVFSDTAVAIVCQNDTTITLNNAYDPDGDRLVYSFGTPYGKPVNPNSFPPLPNPVPYAAGYSLANPFGAGPGNFASINANTGIAKYGAQTNGLYVIAVDVSEYRTINGREVLIGTTRRDLQLVVSSCPPTPPPVLPSTINTPRNYSIEEGQSLSIPISASQASGNHPLVLTVNSALLDGSGPFNTTFNNDPGTVQPGNLTGTASARGTGTVAGTFIFNSTCGNARATPYDLGITVKDNGCGGKLAADIFRISVTRAAPPTGITGPTLVCDPSIVRAYSAAGPKLASYKWRVVGGTLTSGQGTGTAQVTWASTSGTSGTGTLILKGVSAYGCVTDSVVQSVDIRPLPPLSVTATAPSICLGNSTTLNVTGQAGLIYTWSGGGQTAAGTSLTVAPTTTTTYTVVGTNGTCSTSAGFTVTVTPLPVANAGADRSTCSGVSSTPLGAAPLTGATYAWSPANGLSSVAAAQPTVTLPNLTGAPVVMTYTLTVSTGVNCTSTATVNVTINPAATANAGPPLATCSGVASAPLGTPALPGYSYSWSPALGLSSATADQPTLTLPNLTNQPITATYTVVATSVPGCTATSSVIVTVNPAAVATPGPALSFCSGTVSAPLGGPASTGATYAWSPITGLSDPTSPNPTVTGTNFTSAPITLPYTLTITTATGCTASGTVNVTINPAAVADTGPARQTCPNVGVTIGGTPLTGTTYAWTPALGLSSTTTLNPTVTLPNPGPTSLPQTYTLTATTANGCVATGTIVVTVNPASIAQAGPDGTVCDRKQLTLGTPAQSGYTYSWSPGTGLSSLTAAQPVLTAVNTTAQAITRIYTVTVTNATGCVSTSDATVTINPRPAPEAITGPASVCPTVTGITYLITAPAGAAYTWMINGGTIASGQGTASITVDWGPARSRAYLRVFRLNAQGCSSDTTTLPIVINQRLQTVRPTGPGDVVAVAPLPRAVCQADGPYTYHSGAYATGSSYSWLIIGGTQVSTAQNTVTVNWAPVIVPTIGKIVVTETSNPAGGICRGVSDTLRVLINPSPRPSLAIVSPVRVCQTNGPVSFALPGGFAGSTYVFQLNGATLAGAGNSRTLNTLPAPGTYPLTVQETTVAGCVGPLYTTPFTVNPTPAAPVISGSGFVCNTATPQPYAIANPTPGATFQWTVTGGVSTGGGSSSRITVLFNATGPYAVSAAEISPTPASCPGPAATRVITFDNPGLVFASASVDATSNSRIILTLLAPNSTNTPNAVQVLRRVAGTGSFAAVGTVATSATTYTDANNVDASANTYEYQLSLTNGCSTVLTSPVGQTIHLAISNAPGAGGYDQGRTMLSWNAFVGFPVVEYRVYRRSDNGSPVLVTTVPAGTLQATVLNADPGSASGAGFSQNFRVVAAGSGTNALLSNSNEAAVSFANALKTYNIITPNHDGKNDVLVIDNLPLYPGNTLAIFNRWGREVYRTTNYQNNWGGDENIAAGTYYYLLQLPNGTSLRSWFEVVK